jgi:glucokinase
MRTVLAIDLGGTKTAVARVDADGTMHDRATFPAVRSVEASAGQIASVCAGVDAVGIVVPGIFTPDSGRAWCPNLWGPREVALRDIVHQALGTGPHGRVSAAPLPVVIDSDRAGYVLGESWLGAGRGHRHVVFVAIGTGIGVGILADGRLVRGAGGVAGAAGWFALDPRWTPRYGEVGCWEAEAAGPAVAAACGTSDAQAAVAAARRGDSSARAALERAARYTGMGVANLVSVLDPEVVILGGGLMTGASDLLLESIRAEVRRWAQPIAASRCRLELSALGGSAGVLGAARLALDALDEGGR